VIPAWRAVRSLWAPGPATARSRQRAAPAARRGGSSRAQLRPGLGGRDRREGRDDRRAASLRFASSKEALLERLEREAFDETRAVVARIAAPAERARAGRAPARAGSSTTSGSTGRAARWCAPGRSRSEPGLAEELRELSRQNYAVVAAAIEASGRVRHADTRLALEFALYAERSVLREAVLFGEGWAKERRWSDARIAEETVKLVSRYLGLDEPA
jgi:hypothetical protein